MENRTAAVREGCKHTVWINEEARVASFHMEEGYTAQAFSSREAFMSYLVSLQERGFRFW